MDFVQINENFTFHLSLFDSGHPLHLSAMPSGPKASSGLKLTIWPPVKAQSHVIHALHPPWMHLTTCLLLTDMDTGSEQDELTDRSQDDKSDEEEEVQRTTGPVKKTQTRAHIRRHVYATACCIF
jgi:hypothetical protein